MAGGSGERFWPLSRARRPKQLLRLLDSSRTLLEQSAERIAPLIPSERLFIATSEELAEPIRVAASVPSDNVLSEPCRRNTAGCLAWVAAELLARDPGASDWSMAVLTADHFMPDHDAFRSTVETILRHVEEHDQLGVIGIRPTRPETGYGYIELESSLPGVEDSAQPLVALPVRGFREKPDPADAADFVTQGRFLWNSGMFFWRIGAFLRELEAAGQPHARAIGAMAEALRRGDRDRACALFAELPSLPIDVALMEKTSNACVVPARFRWDDIGAWDSLGRLRPRDRSGNIADGETVLVDVRNSVVLNQADGIPMTVAAVGVEDIAIVVTDDAVLVIPKDRAQDVRRVVEELKARDSDVL